MKILPPHGCNSTTKLIAAVRSAPTEFDRRKWIRNNWANTHSNSTQVIFVIANHKDNDTNLRIQSEHEIYGDILWLDYEDGYYSLPMKNYGYYEYAIKYCPNTKCVLNLDSDTVVNLPGFEKLCAVSNESVPMITGKLYGGSPVVRDTYSKWYVPRYIYEKEIYPLYPYGWVKFITGLGALQKLQDTLRIKTPFLVSENYRRLPEDSVYHGDVVHLAGIQLRDVGGINFGQISHWSDSSNGNQKIPLVVQVGEDHRDRIWKEMQTP
uniref:Hexosyltransferase n=1 Tax=Acrobeloides nanus TaxID=290746 RepID=A0A914CC45_9BILA